MGENLGLEGVVVFVFLNGKSMVSKLGHAGEQGVSRMAFIISS